MSKWITTKLNNICSSEKGAVISGPFGSNISSKFFVDKGVPVIRGNNMSLSLDKFYDDGFVFVTEEKAADLNCYAKEGDLIFTAAGTIGQVGILEAPLNYTKYVISNKQLRARIDTKKIDVLYAYYWFSSKWMQEYFIRNNKGSTVPLITLSELKDAPISYPEDVSTQRKIVNVIESLSNKIRINQQICSELEAMAKALYDYWFVQFDFPDENGKPYRTSGGEMVWNEQLKRKIPKGWEATRLGNICDFRNGINYDKDVEGEQEYRIINVRNISSVSLLLNEAELDKITLPSVQADKYLLSSNDIVIARSGTPGATRLLWKINKPTIFCGFIICSTPHEALHKIYLTYCLKRLEGTSATKTGGSILQNVSQDTLKNLFVLIPDREVLRQFNAVISLILEKIHSSIDENNELTKLRDWLLPMLMNGQARVE